MKTILIVDDQLEVRELIRVTLGQSEVEIVEAQNGTQAVEMAAHHHPDLIIMDVMMPGGLDGLQATARIKADPLLQGCKIVLLTAKGQQTDRDAGYKAGADDYFIKPFSPLDLMQKVDEMLETP